MSVEISYSGMYRLGYQDAIDDLRRYLQHACKRADKLAPETFSFNAGWNAALDKLIADSASWDNWIKK